MKVHLDPSNLNSHTSNNLSPISKYSDASKLYETTLSARQTNTIDKIKTFFKDSYATAKSYTATAWEWIVWIVNFCPPIETKIEAVEAMIEEPKDTAKEYAKTPAESMAEVIAATLINPSEVAKLHKENPKEIGSFFGKFKQLLKSKMTELEMGKNNISNAITSLLSFGNDMKPSKSFDKLTTFLQNNRPLVLGALNQYCKHVTDTIGDKSSPKLDALKVVFGSYIPKIAKNYADKEEKFNGLLKALYDSKRVGMSAFLKANIKPTPDEKETAALTTCFKDNSLLFNQMNIPRVLKLDNECSIGFPMGFYQAFLRELSSSQLTEIAELFKEDFPLVNEVILQLGDIRSNSSQYEEICANLPRSIKVLETLKKSFDTPSRED